MQLLHMLCVLFFNIYSLTLFWFESVMFGFKSARKCFKMKEYVWCEQKKKEYENLAVVFFSSQML